MRKSKPSRGENYYLAGAIRGDTSFAEYMSVIMKTVRKYGEPYTEKSETYVPLEAFSVTKPKEKKVYLRDVHWLRQSKAVIAEVSGASTGTGIEIQQAIDQLKPVFCVYHEKALPSLMIKQNPSKYIITQEYKGLDDLSKYLTCFLEIISRSESIDEVRRIYAATSAMVGTPEFGFDKIRQYVLSQLRASKEIGPINFRDIREFTEFMYRNIILQLRWEQLKSQRIGRTFVSGDKPRIIRLLTRYAIDYLANETALPWLSENTERHPTIDFSHVYQQLKQDRLRYNRWAFTKNLRAYRRIGLLLSEEEIKQGTSKFKDQLFLYPSLDGKRRFIPSSSPSQRMNPNSQVTKHFRYLSAFLDNFDRRQLVNLVTEIGQSHWRAKLSETPDIKPRNIDDVQLDSLLLNGWGGSFVRELKERCKKIWVEKYSSFVLVASTHVARDIDVPRQLPIRVLEAEPA